MKQVKEWIINNKAFLIIFAIAILARVSGLGHMIFGDELFYAETAKDQAYVNYYGSHPPLSFWMHSVWGLLIGAAVWKARLLVSLLSLVNIALTYIIAKKYYGKKAATWASLLLSLSVWFTIGSLQLDMDASFVSFFFLISVFFYTKWLETGKTQHLSLIGLFYGLGILTKFTAVLIGPILAMHYLINYKPFQKKTFLNFLKNFSTIALIGFALFLIFPIFGFLTGSTSFKAAFTHGTELLTSRNGAGTDYGLLAIQFLNAIVWISPLLIGLLLYSALYSKKKKSIFFIWALVVIFFYTFVIQDNFRPIEKYLLITAPALSIIGGEFLSNLSFKRKHLMLLGAATFIWFAFLLIFNLQQGTFIDFYPKSNFLTQALNFNLLLNMPLEGHAGPIGFYVLAGTIFLTFILAGILFIGSLAARKKAAFAYLVILFLGVSLGYNLYLSEEYLIGAVKPNIDKISSDTISYLLKENYNSPLFVFRNIGFEYYLEDRFGRSRDVLGNMCNTYSDSPCIDKSKTYYLDFKDEFDKKTMGLIDKNHPTVAVIDYPQINKQSYLWQRLLRCDLVKTFSDKGTTLGYVFNC